MPTVTIGSNSVDVDGWEDTTTYNLGPAVNYNTSQIVIEGSAGNRVAFVRATGLSTIPSSAIVSDASLHFYKTNSFGGSTQTINVYRMLKPWGESTATYNTYNGVDAWFTAGALGPGSDYASTLSATATASAANDVWMTFTGAQLIADVQGMVDESYDNDGWILRQTAGSQITFPSENTGADGFRPYLTVTYSLAGTIAPKVARFLTMLNN